MIGRIKKLSNCISQVPLVCLPLLRFIIVNDWACQKALTSSSQVPHVCLLIMHIRIVKDYAYHKAFKFVMIVCLLLICILIISLGLSKKFCICLLLLHTLNVNHWACQNVSPTCLFAHKTYTYRQRSSRPKSFQIFQLSPACLSALLCIVNVYFWGTNAAFHQQLINHTEMVHTQWHTTQCFVTNKGETLWWNMHSNMTTTKVLRRYFPTFVLWVILQN